MKHLKATEMVIYKTGLHTQDVHRSFPWKELIWIETHQAAQEQFFMTKGKIAPIMTALNKSACAFSILQVPTLSSVHLVFIDSFSKMSHSYHGS